jgi:hypothetical protein
MMTFNDAEKITHIWGRYLEFTFGKLTPIFMSRIPESSLPFPKGTLLEALSIMSSYFAKTGDKHNLDLINGTTAIVDSFYLDDEEALLSAAKDFNNPEWREVFIPNLKKMQKEWIKTQGDFDGVY